MRHRVCVDAEDTTLNYNQIYLVEYTFNQRCLVYSQDNDYKGTYKSSRFKEPVHKTWITASGEPIKIKDMNTDHLLNAINMLQRWAVGENRKRKDIADEFLSLMQAEVRERQKPHSYKEYKTSNTNYNKQKRKLKV